MKIGLPRAMLYYRYGTLWNTFFKDLGCDVVMSSETNQAMMEQGISQCIGECCLPTKVFLGHVAQLVGQCDYILVPRFERLGKNEEFCMRMWGLPDIVRNTFSEASVLTYNLQSANDFGAFFKMGKSLGKSSKQVIKAYYNAQHQQKRADEAAIKAQKRLLLQPDLKVLLVSQPYIIHDAHIGAPLVRMIREQGAEPIFADRFDRDACIKQSTLLSKDLYWAMNKEAIGAIPLAASHVDGIVLITAFPCGTDSLVNELVLRRAKAIPITNIVLDEQQGEAGLQTRIECFLDILKERRRSSAS